MTLEATLRSELAKAKKEAQIAKEERDRALKELSEIRSWQVPLGDGSSDEPRTMPRKHSRIVDKVGEARRERDEARESLRASQLECVGLQRQLNALQASVLNGSAHKDMIERLTLENERLSRESHSWSQLCLELAGRIYPQGGSSCMPTPADAVASLWKLRSEQRIQSEQEHSALLIHQKHTRQDNVIPSATVSTLQQSRAHYPNPLRISAPSPSTTSTTLVERASDNLGTPPTNSSTVVIKQEPTEIETLSGLSGGVIDLTYFDDDDGSVIGSPSPTNLTLPSIVSTATPTASVSATVIGKRKQPRHVNYREEDEDSDAESDQDSHLTSMSIQSESDTHSDNEDRDYKPATSVALAVRGGPKRASTKVTKTNTAPFRKKKTSALNRGSGQGSASVGPGLMTPADKPIHAPLTASGKIPKPPGMITEEGGAPAKRYMKLWLFLSDWSEDTYHEVRVYAGEVVDEKLDPSKQFRDQDQRKVEESYQKMIDRFPTLMGRYEDNWPAEDMIRSCHQNRRNHVLRGRRGGRDPAKSGRRRKKQKLNCA